MKASTILRLAALVGLGAVLLGWAAAISAADPTGDSPANGIPIGAGPVEVCQAQTLAPGAQVWLMVSYHAGTDLEMRTQDAAGVNFDIYAPSQVANWSSPAPQPTGRLLPDPREPGYTDTWKGHLIFGKESGFYYVLVTNTNAYQVTFSFCTIETPLFTPPPSTGAPDTSSDSPSSSSPSSSSPSSTSFSTST